MAADSAVRPASASCSGGGRCVGVGTLAAALLGVLVLFAAGVLFGLARGGAGADAEAQSRAAAAPSSASEPSTRARAVQLLLDRRAAAVRHGDRDGFLETVDPASTAFRARQAASFDALDEVPLDRWEYRLDPMSEQRPDPALDLRYAPGTWWGPGVTLTYTLTDLDSTPLSVREHLTFVRRAGRWHIAADDDFADRGDRTPRQIWDGGAVVAVREPGVLVLGHPGHTELLADVARRTAAAVPAVNAVWQDGWSRSALVLVPATPAELSTLLDRPIVLTQIAALATAELRGDQAPRGDRILVNPTAFAGLGPVGRRVVLTHELTHVASRAQTGPATPVWLAEGLADYVAYQGVDAPLSVTAAELRTELRAGRIPAALPTDDAFDSTNPRLASAYAQAWLATRLLVQQHGRDGYLELYRSVGARRDADPARALEHALEGRGSSTALFTAQWRDELERTLR